MGNYPWELTIWLLLIMAGAPSTVASQDNCLTEERYNEHQAHLEKIIQTMADSLSSLTTRNSPLCTDNSITETLKTTGSAISGNTATPEDFYAAARDGNDDYIIIQLEQDTSSTGSSNSINNLLTWPNEDDYNRTALHVAAAQGHAYVVLALLQAGASPNVEDIFGRTPVHLAAKHGRIAALKTLIKSQGHVNHKSNGDATPLHYAAVSGHSDALRVLVAYGANVNMVDDKGRSPLMEASKYGQVATVKALINADAALEDADHKGLTALHLAAVFNQPDVARLLLENGADKELQDIHGRTPAALARGNGTREHRLNEIADLIDNWQ